MDPIPVLVSVSVLTPPMVYVIGSIDIGNLPLQVPDYKIGMLIVN